MFEQFNGFAAQTYLALVLLVVWIIKVMGLLVSM